MDVTILHEYGAVKHFAGLSYLELKGLLDLRWAEFNIPTQIAQIVLCRGKSSLSRTIHNISEMGILLTTKGKTVIVGAAPYDWIIPYLNILKSRHRLIYFTSWPYWDSSVYAKRPLAKGIVRQWQRFLFDIDTVCVTDTARRSIENLVHHAYHIPHAVNTEIFYSEKHVLDKKEKIKVLYVGQLTKRKGIEMLVSIIMKKQVDAEFWFAGKGPYRKTIEDLHKRGYARYFGYIQDEERLASIYRKCDILVLPSIDDVKSGQVENFGIVLIEAMASGIPVVATDCVGPSEIVKHGENGLLIPQHDQSSLVNALNTLIEEPSLRMKMGKNGVKMCHEKYSIQTVGKLWQQVLFGNT